MMPSVWVLTSVAAIVVSFLIGFLFFYIVSPLEKIEKKQQFEEITSLLIHFVIYIWIGKIIWNVSIFVQDPMAVLAYPSDSNAFYIALFLVFINIGYKVKRHHISVVSLLYAFVPIFLAASFAYEFIQMIVYGNIFSLVYMGLLMVLIVLFMFLDGRASMPTIAFFMLIIWTIGKLVLSFMLPFTTIFGYMISSVFLIILLVFLIGLYVVVTRKGR